MSRPVVAFYLDQLGLGGVERTVLNLMEALEPRGFQPTLVLNEAKGELLAEVPAGLPVIALGARRLLASSLALNRYLRQERPAILVTSRMVQSAGAALARRLGGFPTRMVFTEHSLLTTWMHDPRMPRRRVDELLYHLAPAFYRAAEAVVGVSRASVSELARHLRLPADRLHLLYNPALPADLEARRAAPVTPPWPEDGRPLILGVGRLSPEKGFDHLLEAFARLSRTHPARLAIAGIGPATAELARYARTLGVAEDVHFLGYQANIFPWLARASAFALSSSLENFPLAILEALAAGTPVVSFNCPYGPAEILTHEEDGLLVPPGDPAALAESLARVLSEPELARRLAKAGPRRAAAFTLDPCAGAYAALFHRLLSPSARRQASCASPSWPSISPTAPCSTTPPSWPTR